MSILQNISTAVLKNGPNEMRSIRKTKVQMFSVWKEHLVVTPIWYSHHEVVGGLSENFRKTDEISFKDQFCVDQAKHIKI